jgi:metal-responsive CopG/Arc/MetJ family transcriptional regulator
MTGVRLPDPLRKKLDAWAQDEGITRSEAIRRLVENGLAK